MVRGQIRRVSADALEAEAREMARPLRVKHPVLGTLSRATGQTEFTGRLTVGSRRVALTMHESQKLRGEPVVKLAAAALARIDFAALPTFVVKRLYRLTPEWSPRPLTREQFLKKLKLAEVSTHPDGDVDVAFDSGDVFTDHRVTVSVKNGKPRSASLE